MPAPLPIELRQRVVNAYMEKGGYQRIADQFDVSFDSVRRWVQLQKNHKSVAPMPHAGGPKPKILPTQFNDLKKLVQENSDQTLCELADTWANKYDKEIHFSSIWRALDKAGITYKKNLPCN